MEYRKFWKRTEGFPLDHAQQNVLLMAVSPGDQVATPIWNVYDRLCLRG
jgi:hypothetical protein